MLIKFTCDNFKSFKDKVEFSMLASSRNEHQAHLRRVDNFDVLTTSLIYGANASGKSNLVNALMISKSMICNRPKSETQKLLYDPFTFDEESLNKDTVFEYVIKVNEETFTYGFSHNSNRINSEWLYLMAGGRKKKIIFERTTNNESVLVEFNKLFLPNKDDLARVKFIETGTWENELFLKRAADEKIDILIPVLHWFDSQLVIVKPDAQYTQLEMDLAHKRDFIKIASEFMKSIGTGVEKISINRLIVDFEKDFSEMPEEIKDGIQRDLSAPESFVYVISPTKNIPFVFTKDKGDNIILLKLRASHKMRNGQAKDLDWENESDGTKRILHILPAILDAVTSDKTYIFDEIERSLHPAFTKIFIDRCIKLFTEQNAGQLIATTHASQLLDQKILRRDEVNFIEKNDWGESFIMSLSKIKGVRKDLKLEKGYFEGRFGAIPFIDEIIIAMEKNGS